MTTTYNVYKDGVLLHNVSSPSDVISGLTNGTTYSFRVARVVDGIEGAQSPTVLATPGVASPPGEVIDVGTGGIGITVTTNNLTIDGKTINGPQSAVYRGGEMGIYANGTAGSPITNLTIRNCTIRNFGNAGIYLRHVTNVLIEDCVIEDVVYTGIMVLSGVGGTISGNTVRRVGIYGAGANSNNAYGIAVTHTESPRSSDVIVDGNTVEDVPSWEAMDTHGGIRIDFINNIVRRSRRGVMITGGAQGETGSDCDVLDNQFLSPVSIPANDQWAIVPVGTLNTTAKRNTITGWGSGRDILTTYPNTNLVYPTTGPDANIVTP